MAAPRVTASGDPQVNPRLKPQVDPGVSDPLALSAGHSWLNDDDRARRYARDRTTTHGLALRCVDVGEPHAYNGTAVDLGGGRQLVFYRGGGRWPGDRLRTVVLPAGAGRPTPRDAGLPGHDEDPRVVAHDGRLFVSTAKYDGQGVWIELWEADPPDARGHVALHPRGQFHTVHDWPGYVKLRFEKNWAPFSHGGRLWYVYSARPHRVLAVDLTRGTVRLAHETGGDAVRCHGLADPDADVRLNAPPVRLADGRFLCTYHVVRPVGARFDYYTGFYAFAGQPPFAPLASTGPFLVPEDAEGVIPHDARPTRCVFVTGMTVDENRDAVILWGGDSDRRVMTARLPLSRVLDALW